MTPDHRNLLATAFLAQRPSATSANRPEAWSALLSFIRTWAEAARFLKPNGEPPKADIRRSKATVHGHKKVPVCGQVRVPAGGQLKVPPRFVVSCGIPGPGR